ncbi:MAG TPA: apolipoprotein N-acyltransferase, partial [Propionibacteriaceae bacterium]|nr:apolipoprotein N-acyltransferase [Propionibacteriaceae bacterium]
MTITTTSPPADDISQPAQPARPALPLGWAIVTSALAGVGLDAAFPELGWWPIAFVSVTLALLALAGRKSGGAFLVALVYGGAFFVAHLSWAGRFLGPLPWLGLAGLQALLFAAGAIPIALAYRWSTRTLRGKWGQLVIVPLLVGGLWTLRESIMGSWPYGGFPWARLGMSQAG